MCIMQQYTPLLILLLVASPLHITASTVYHVMPDNHYHPISDNTHTLQHYLNNTNKYFTSNTQLHFLPGQYYLNNDLIIQGVSNFSLIGNRTNEVINTVINCTSPAGIAVVNSSNIVITNIVMNDCGNDYTTFLNNYSFEGKIIHTISLLFLQCKVIVCMYFCTNAGGIQFINPLINTELSNITVKFLGIWYNEHAENVNHTFRVDNFQFYDNSDEYSIQIKQLNTSSSVSVIIQHVYFTNTKALHTVCINSIGHNYIIISDCHFTSRLENVDLAYDYHNNDYDYAYFEELEYIYNNTHSNSTVYAYYEDSKAINKPNNIQFINCHFIKNFGLKALIEIITQNSINNELVDLTIVVTDCVFHNNQYVQVLFVDCWSNNQIYCILLSIKNTTLSSNIHFQGSLIYTYRTKIDSQQMKVNSNYINPILYSFSIFEMDESYLQFGKYNEFYNNTSPTGINALSIHVQEGAAINFTANTMAMAFFVSSLASIYQSKVIAHCFIQYISKKGNLDNQFQSGDKLNYYVSFSNNNMKKVSNIDLMHCSWDSHSAFSTTRPTLVNKRFVAYNFSNDTHEHICLCNKYEPKNCYNKDFGPSYPGQNIVFGFTLANDRIKQALLNTMDHSDIVCTHEADKSIVFELQYDKCKTIKYKVMYNHRGWCEFALQVNIIHTETITEIGAEAYTILLQPCPKGFSLHLEEYCQCDQILSSYIPSLTHCNIDDQTIPRPANSWISAHTVNNSHSYHVSLHCPFDYCLPHSSHLYLSTPDSQCQFDRSGLLCGQCQQGLSAVFGSSQCKHCSNVYLLIIIPIAIAGLVLVLLLFGLNLTVTNGDINAFLFYANIISINIPLFFPDNRSVTYVLISLLNLDLGIETCFYNGMDGLARNFLQLVFPVYLIFIAILIIVTSHYSGRIQRLTARRALPVLATLFLLSYTKTLLAVSNVLFFYSTITHLPSNDETLVWSVDANVLLFGASFTILFTTCLLIFLLLIPFNMLLIFTRTLSRFKTVNRFKPILDAYQGPYKTKYYHWTGLQLLMRAIFFGLSALDRSINVIVSAILLGIMIWLYEKASPFNSKANNVIEIVSLLNLQAMFIISYFTSASDVIINILVSLEMFQLACIILVHLKMATCRSYTINFNITDMINKFYVIIIRKSCKKDQREEIDLEDISPSPVIDYKEFQEPLIGQW